MGCCMSEEEPLPVIKYDKISDDYRYNVLVYRDSDGGNVRQYLQKREQSEVR